LLPPWRKYGNWPWFYLNSKVV